MLVPPVRGSVAGWTGAFTNRYTAVCPAAGAVIDAAPDDAVATGVQLPFG